MDKTSDSQSLRHALGAFATGVTIITAVDADGNDVGMTVNSFNSVSLTPPMVLWSLGRGSTNIAAFLQAKHFAVHVLAADQDALATRFAQRGVDRFAGLERGRGADGIPLLDGAAARFECRTAFQYEGGDHVIFVGEVLKYDHWPREPLVFKRGRFALALQLEALITNASSEVDARVAERLQELGLVTVDGQSRPTLTDGGQQTLIDLLAVAEASSAAAGKPLDPNEARALRHLLSRIIDSDQARTPQP